MLSALVLVAAGVLFLYLQQREANAKAECLRLFRRIGNAGTTVEEGIELIDRIHELGCKGLVTREEQRAQELSRECRRVEGELARPGISERERAELSQRMERLGCPRTDE